MKMQGKAWFLEGLILALTLIICWLALTTPPPCDYGCLKIVGPANCEEVVQSAAEYHDNPNCLGTGKCRPAGDVSKQQIAVEHEVLDGCKASNGQTHLQHVTVVKWDSDLDGRTDTECAARHSCP
jgi:hypothetical protein